MNVFNRIVTVLVLLALLLVIIVVAAFPAQAAQGVAVAARNVGAFFETASAASFWLFTLARVGIVVAALVIVGLLLAGEVRRGRPRPVRVHTQAGSEATVTTDSVARRLTWQIDQLADVVSVTPDVRAHGRAVDVLLDLETAPDIDVPMKTDEVVALAREVIAERMGLQPGKIQVRIKHAPFQEKV